MAQKIDEAITEDLLAKKKSETTRVHRKLKKAFTEELAARPKLTRQGSLNMSDLVENKRKSSEKVQKEDLVNERLIVKSKR